MRAKLTIASAIVLFVTASFGAAGVSHAQQPTVTPQAGPYNTVVTAEVPQDWAEYAGGNWSLRYPKAWEVMEKSPDRVSFSATGAKVCDIVVENNPLPLAVDDPKAIDVYAQGVIESTRTSGREVRLMGVGRWLRGVLGLYFDMQSVDKAADTAIPVTAIVSPLGSDRYVRLTLLSATPDNLNTAGAMLSSMASTPASPAGAAESAPVPTVPLKPAGSLSGQLSFAGSTTFQPLAAKLAEAFRGRYPKVQLDIAGGGSLVGVQAIHEGTVDFGMVSRELKPEEAKGIEAHKIAVDVVAVGVHPSNPVSGLTLADLKGIYSGQITNWSQVGGKDQPIVVVIREKTSGTRGAFDDIVLGGKEASAPNQKTAMTAGDVEAILASDSGAIGYLGFGNLGSDVKTLAVDGVLPAAATARDGSYKLRRPLELLTGPLSQPMTLDFIAFALSPEGQNIVTTNGWVSVR